jgi:DNA-binding transcriptional LysR family regulator
MREAHLRDLIAVVESGSLRSAAKQLGISLGAVSKNLSALEKNLGVPLLVRTTQGVQPTEYGRIVLRRARVVEAELRHMQEELDVLGGAQLGTVSVGLSATSETALLPAVIGRFRGTHPQVMVSVMGGRSASTIAALREGRIDFAIGPALSEAESADLHLERLFSTDLAVVARAGHPKSRATALEELADMEWVTALREPRSLLTRPFAERGLRHPSIAAHSDSSSATLTLLLGTDLLSISPLAAVQPYVDAGLLAVLPIELGLPPVIQHLITPGVRPLTPFAQALSTEFRRASRALRR